MHPRTKPAPILSAVLCCRACLLPVPLFSRKTPRIDHAPRRFSTPCRHTKPSASCSYRPRMDPGRLALVDDKLTSQGSKRFRISQTIGCEGDSTRNVAWSARQSRRIAVLSPTFPGSALAIFSSASNMERRSRRPRGPLKHAELKGYVPAHVFLPIVPKLAILFVRSMPRVAGPLHRIDPTWLEWSIKKFRAAVSRPSI